MRREQNVFVITGSPASGKTYYAKNNAGENDIVFDLDAVIEAIGGKAHSKNEKALSVALAMRSAALDAIASRRGNWENAYVITSSSSRDEIADLCRKLGADHVPINTPMQECINNAMNDSSRPDKAEQIRLIKEWHENMSTPKSTSEQFAEWFKRSFPAFDE